jgi:histidinol phosphatase-like enzyme
MQIADVIGDLDKVLWCPHACVRVRVCVCRV